ASRSDRVRRGPAGEPFPASLAALARRLVATVTLTTSLGCGTDQRTRAGISRLLSHADRDPSWDDMAASERGTLRPGVPAAAPLATLGRASHPGRISTPQHHRSQAAGG